MCSAKLRALAEDDPQMTLLAPSRAPKWEVVNLDGAHFSKMYRTPRAIQEVRFPTRTLIEGLVAHGILRPGDIPDLMVALQRVAPVPAFQDRILESFFRDERIRDVQRMVRCQYLVPAKYCHRSSSSSCDLPAPDLASGSDPPCHDPNGTRDAHPYADWATHARAIELRHKTLCGPP